MIVKKGCQVEIVGGKTLGFRNLEGRIDFGKYFYKRGSGIVARVGSRNNELNFEDSRIRVGKRRGFLLRSVVIARDAEVPLPIGPIGREVVKIKCITFAEG